MLHSVAMPYTEHETEARAFGRLFRGVREHLKPINMDFLPREDIRVVPSEPTLTGIRATYRQFDTIPMLTREENTDLGNQITQLRQDIDTYITDRHIDPEELASGKRKPDEKLCQLIGQIDEQAHLLALGNWRLIKDVIEKTFSHYSDQVQDDLFSAGLDTLQKVALTYDSARGAFSSYAYPSIRGRMKTRLGDERLIKMPIYERGNALRWQKKALELQERGADVTQNELVAYLFLVNEGMASPTEKDIQDLFKKIMSSLDNYDFDKKLRGRFWRFRKRLRHALTHMEVEELDQPRRILWIDPVSGERETFEGNRHEGSPSAVVDEGPTPEEAACQTQEYEVVRWLLEQLPKREREVMWLRMAFDGQNHTLDDIATIMGVTPEWIRQIQARAERRLRSFIRQYHLSHLRPTYPN